jgi:hypothetical protein
MARYEGGSHGGAAIPISSPDSSTISLKLQLVVVAL